MTTLAELLRSGFLPQLFAAMTVNFEIAALALAVGLALGLPLALLTLRPGIGRTLASPVLGVLRAAPTFVVMFFLLYALPREGAASVLSGPNVVALSLVPYAAAYLADNGREAIHAIRRGATGTALLFLPNMLRAYVVLVMSSGAGAAIGVNEGVSVVLREAELRATLGEKLVVFGVGVLAFGAVFQIGFALMRLAVRLLSPRRPVPIAPSQASAAVAAVRPERR